MSARELESASPLAWPLGRKRTAFRRTSRFRCTFGIAMRELQGELERLGARQVVVSSNLDLRLDGQPRAGGKIPSDPGIAVYFDLPKTHGLAAGRIVLACDAWTKVEDNVRAIARHIAAIRGMERWGVGSIAQAFTGYRALPAPGANPRTWRDVLGFGPHGTVPASDVERHFRGLAKTAHPDAGGSAAAFQELARAREEALQELARSEP